MYRTDATDKLQKIERLERDLNAAYEDQFPTEDDPVMGLALLRFRAQRLAHDVESLRKKHQREPLWTRLKKRVTRFGLGLGFVAGASTVGLGLGVHALWTEARPPSALDSFAFQGASIEPPTAIEPAATATTSEPATTDPPTTGSTEAPEQTVASPEPPSSAHYPLSTRDYKDMLALSQTFFRAVARHDGPALAELAHPRNGLLLADEQLSLTPALLRDCFTNRHVHQVPVSQASEEMTGKTCGQIFAFYAEKPFARAPDVLFDTVPWNVAANGTQPDPPYMFFYLPPPEDNELSWDGLTLDFDRYGGELVLVSVRHQYWTP